MTIDAFEMALVHQVFRNELTQAPSLIRQVQPGDTQRARVISAHLENIMMVLHHHHAAEDDLLWPLLRMRAPVNSADVMRMQDEHLAVDAAMSQLTAARSRWSATADHRHAEELIDSVEELSARLAEHLADEEQHIVPLINAHITTQEWNAVLARAAAVLNRKNIQFVLAFGSFVLQDSSAEERRRFLDGVPMGPRILLRLFGNRAFDSYRAKVYGAR
jgi:hemerythrin-like domain-containing protein